MENKELKELKPTLDFITEEKCLIKVFCNHSDQVDALLQIFPKLYPDIFLYYSDDILTYIGEYFNDLDDDGSDVEEFYESCFSNGYSLLIELEVKNGQIRDWSWGKVKQRKRDISIHTEKYSMKFSQFKTLLFNASSINDSNNDMYINMEFFKRFDDNDHFDVYCDNDEQVQTLLEKYPILYPDIFTYNNGYLFHKDVVRYIENMETDDPNYEYYDFDSFYKSCFTDGYKLVINLRVKQGEIVEWTWSKGHIDSMELADFTFDNFHDSLFKKENK